MVRLRNQSDTPLSIDRIVHFDSLGIRVEQQHDLRKVSRATRRSLAQHRDQGLNVKASASPGVYIAGGAVATTYGAAAVSVGTAGGVLGTSSGLAVAGLGAATGGVALLAAGVDRAVQRGRINRQFEDPGFGTTATIAPTSSKSGSLFFPIVPVPDRIEVSFHTAAGPGLVSMDLKNRLAGLHVASASPAGRQIQAPPQ